MRAYEEIIVISDFIVGGAPKGAEKQKAKGTTCPS